jgi:hypothetical protein
VHLVLRVPEGSREEAEAALPAIDVSGLAGARVALRRGFVRQEGEGVSLRAACVIGPSDKWAPGVEELVLDRATSMVRRALETGADADIHRLDVGPIQPEGRLFTQLFHGQARRHEVTVVVEGRHALGFVGEARDAVLCTVLCVAPLGQAPARASACEDLARATSLEGALMEAPPPSVMVRLILVSAERPLAAGIVLAVLAVLAVAVILARRPRPRP